MISCLQAGSIIGGIASLYRLGVKIRPEKLNGIKALFAKALISVSAGNAEEWETFILGKLHIMEDDLSIRINENFLGTLADIPIFIRPAEVEPWQAAIAPFVTNGRVTPDSINDRNYVEDGKLYSGETNELISYEYNEHGKWVKVTDNQ